MSTTSAKAQRVSPLLSGDETRYRRRYRTLKDMVNELSDESNLLALRVYQIQRRIYEHSLQTTGRPPAPVPLPTDALWAPLVQNATAYPSETGAPLLPREEKEEVYDKPAESRNRSVERSADEADDY